eukprot:8658871-Alexandrium_andersonii.AAC.1
MALQRQGGVQVRGAGRMQGEPWSRDTCANITRPGQKPRSDGEARSAGHCREDEDGRIERKS